MKYILCILLLAISATASAETYLQINGTSLHNKPGYNQVNYGGGVEQTVSENWNVAGGWYRNSEYRGSAYAYGRYSFYRAGLLDVGVGVGIVTGYNRMKVLPMAFPEVCYSYVCTLFLPQVEPAGASVLGFHLKIPVN
jgi:hypothetical protein